MASYILGAGSGLVPMYLTEISPVNIRGAMGVVHQFALTCGIFVSQVMGLHQVLGKSDIIIKLFELVIEMNMKHVKMFVSISSLFSRLAYLV